MTVFEHFIVKSHHSLLPLMNSKKVVGFFVETQPKKCVCNYVACDMLFVTFVFINI